MTVSADLSNEFTSIISETNVYEVSFGRPAKIFSIFYQDIKFLDFQSFINVLSIVLLITPMNPDADVTYQRINLFSPEKCFIYFIYDVPHYIR